MPSDALPHLAVLTGVVLLACVSPGPDFVAVTAQSLAGRRGGLGVAIGVALGCLVLASLAMAGFGLLLSQIAWAYDAIRLIGAAYLAWLGLKMLRSALWAGAGSNDLRRVAPLGMITGIRRGLAVNLTNPKAAAFFGSLFVSVLPPGAVWQVYAAALAIVVLVTAGWFVVVALVFSVARIRTAYLAAERWIDGFMGVVLIALGIRLAVNR